MQVWNYEDKNKNIWNGISKNKYINPNISAFF